MGITPIGLKNSIILRYLGLTSILFLVVQLAFGIWQAKWDRMRQLANLERKVEATANLLAAIAQKDEIALDDLTLEYLLEKTDTDRVFAYSLVVDADGRILNSFLDRQMPAIANAIKQQTVETIDVGELVESVRQNTIVREVRSPILSAGRSLGEVRIGYSLENLNGQTIHYTQTMLASALGISILLAGITIFLFDRKLRSPLKTLAADAIAISGAPSGDDEFASLKSSIAAIKTKLQTLDELQQHIVERQAIEKELENLSHSKSQFLATISHEIRTPLNAIAGMTGLLVDTKLNEEQQEFVDIIRISGERLLTMINNILDFSKIEADKLELEEQPFDLAECVEESLRMFLSQAADKDLELAYLIEPQTPTSILGDSVRLRQVLSNLIGNAVKFTHNGEVAIYVNANPRQSAEKNGKTAQQEYEIRFAVKDTGIGIPAERIDRLFQSFSQVDASVARNYGGTGLGLSISKQLCELMGGKMWVHSTEGKGSTFYFTVAVKADASAVPANRQEIQRDLIGKRVLIVDDNATNQKILTLQAQSWGMYTCAVESGAKALEWLQRGVTFDVALLDMNLPNMDGIALAREIRKQSHCRNLPLVMLTSFTRQDIDRASAELNFAAIASKPLQQSQLYHILMQIFTGKPLKAISSSPTPSPKKTLTEKQPLRILVAEDVAVNQEVIRLLLQKLGYWADIVSNGLETIKALRRQPYDVVLMDVRMPEMDGLEATRQICRQIPPQMRPRIVAMTAEVTQGDREKCLAIGMDDYIAKPIRLDELRRVLSQCRLLSTREPLDIDLEESIREMTGQQSPELFADSVRSYLENIPLQLTAIATAVERQDRRSLNRAIGTLQTISTHLGANQLSRLCQEIEIVGYSANISEASQKIAEIEVECETVCQTWHQALQKLKLESSKL